MLPSEEAWVLWVEGRIQDNTNDEKKVSLIPSSVDNLLRGGFGGKGKEYEERATQVQLAFERWVLKQKGVCDLLLFLLLGYNKLNFTCSIDNSSRMQI